jgi:tetratricopeptide (TPR) repeat protein
MKFMQSFATNPLATAEVCCIARERPGPHIRALAALLFFAFLTTGIASAASDQEVCAARQGDKSIAACARLIAGGRLDPSEQSTIYALRGATYRNSGEYDRAIADFTQAIELLRKFGSSEVVAAAYVARASVYSLKGQTDAALADYRAAIKQNPRNEQAESNIQRIEATLPQAKPIAASKAAESLGAAENTPRLFIDGNLTWAVVAGFVGLAMYVVLSLRRRKAR